MVRRAGVRPLSTVEEGARAILNLATSPAVEGQIGLPPAGSPLRNSVFAKTGPRASFRGQQLAAEQLPQPIARRTRRGAGSGRLVMGNQPHRLAPWMIGTV